MDYSRGQPNSNCSGYIHSDSHCDSNVHTYANANSYSYAQSSM